MSQGPYKLETKFGNVWITVTEGNHAYLEFGHNLNVEQEGLENGDRRGPVKIRGVVYAGSAHMYRWTDGKWYLGPESHKENYYMLRQSLHMRKLFQPYGKDYPSDAAFKTCEPELILTFRDWAFKHPTVFEKAELDNLYEQLSKHNEKIQEFKMEMAAVQRTKDDLVTRINKIETNGLIEVLEAGRV